MNNGETVYHSQNGGMINTNVNNRSNEIPNNYKPLSSWSYFGYSLLFSIPLVGFILLIVFSFNNDNINRKNFARSYWCRALIIVIITIVMALIFSLLGITLDNFNFQQYM